MRDAPTPSAGEIRIIAIANGFLAIVQDFEKSAQGVLYAARDADELGALVGRLAATHLLDGEKGESAPEATRPDAVPDGDGA